MAAHPLDAAEQVIRDAMDAAGRDAVAAVRESVGSPSPPSSREGEPPHRRSGRLQNEIGSAVTSPGQGVIDLSLTSDAPYSGFVEATRPFMAPAAERLELELPERITAAVTAARL